jgi:hypothetical protein
MVNISFVIGPVWQNLNTLLDTIKLNKSKLFNIHKFYITTNHKNVENYFKVLNDDKIICIFFGENQGHQLSCYNSIISGMKMVIDDENDVFDDNEDVVIFSHEDCYVHDVDIFKLAVEKITKQNYDIVCREFIGTSIGQNYDYYMNDTFFIKKSKIKDIFKNADIKHHMEDNYWCEKYFTELICKFNVFKIKYVYATHGETELGMYHIPTVGSTSNVNKNLDKSHIIKMY